MAGTAVRFLHAADLRLDCPLRDVGQLHDEVREIVDGATLIAFDRLITTAIDRDVDALLITGNTFDADYASLAAEVAMRDGFDRLAERHVPVFIVPGRMDPASAWLELPRLPKNVTVFTDVSDEPVDLTDHGQVMATLIPVNAEASVEPVELMNILDGRKGSSDPRPFVIGMLLGNRVDDRKSRKKKDSAFAALDWLACPAGMDNDALPLTDGQVHSQSTSQGLSLDETGARGAAFVEIDSARRAKTTQIPLAPVRFERLVQSIDRIKNRDDMLEQMLAQIERLPHVKGELVRVVDWKLDRTNGEANGWESDDVVDELTTALLELSDQPDGLRYIHRVHAIEPDLTLIESGHREVLTEFLLALERRAPADRSVFEKWLADAKVEQILKSGRWESWAQSISQAEVTERAQQLGWKWFATIGKK